MKTKRQEVDWKTMLGTDLLKTVVLLEKHAPCFVVEAIDEVSRRAGQGNSFVPVIFENDTPPLYDHEVPNWLKVFPFSLLSAHQRKKRGWGRG